MPTFFGQRGGGFFIFGRPHFLEQTLQIFQNIQCVRTDKTWDWVSADIFQTRGGRVNFTRTLLWTAS